MQAFILISFSLSIKKPTATTDIPELKNHKGCEIFPGKYYFFMLFIKHLTLVTVRDTILGKETFGMS